VSLVATRRRSYARTAVLPARRALPELRKLTPSVRSILVGLALLGLAVGAYVAARDSSVFAVRTLEIRGGTAAVRAEVRAALAPDLGKSLLRIDGGDIGSRLAPLPDIHSFHYDRSFPHTLRLVIRRERPVLVVRRGAGAFLVAASGRVLRPLAHPRLSRLPRLWLTKDVAVRAGDQLPAGAAAAATALAPLEGAPLPGGVKLVRGGAKELTLVLGGGLEVRLGDAGDLRLKLAIARRILRATGAAATGHGYLDVSVPERPVLFPNSQVVG
jgi:cell division septal protein FtsQ